LDRIRAYEEQLNAQSSDGLNPAFASPGSPGETPGPESPLHISSTLNRELQPQIQNRTSYADDDPAVSPGNMPFSSLSNNSTQEYELTSHQATDLTSGPAFESQVRSLLHRSSPNDAFHGLHPKRQDGSHREPNWTSARELVKNASEVTFPSLEESQHLLEQFLFYLGVSQHFFDPRSFSDDLMLLFQNSETREQQMRSPWFMEYLLVMAMAMLMDVRHPTSQPPGSDLFAEALKRLPPLHNMGGEGVIIVEVLTLIATYLQWCDRKHDAYLHVCVPRSR
jgi:hypothetical protein